MTKLTMGERGTGAGGLESDVRVVMVNAGPVAREQAPLPQVK